MPRIIHGQHPNKVHHQNSHGTGYHHDHHQIVGHHISDNLSIFLNDVKRSIIGQNACILFHILNNIIEEDSAAYGNHADEASGQSHQKRNGIRDLQVKKNRRQQEQIAVPRLKPVIKNSHHDHQYCQDQGHLQRNTADMSKKHRSCQKRHDSVRQKSAHHTQHRHNCRTLQLVHVAYIGIDQEKYGQTQRQLDQRNQICIIFSVKIP